MALSLRDRHIFVWLSPKISNQIFWKTKTWSNIFLVESAKIEWATFPYKIALSEANLKTNWMGVQNGPITESGVFRVTFFFLKISFQFKNLLQRVDAMY